MYKSRIIKQSITPQGYLIVRLSKHSKTLNEFVHRMVAEAYCINDNSKPMVNHIDGNKLNNHANNLEWVTPSENMQHAANTGLLTHKHLIGENNHRSKLTTTDVLKIRELVSQGQTLTSVAKAFNIMRSHVKDIVVGIQWKHIPIGIIPNAKFKESVVSKNDLESMKQLRNEGTTFVEIGKRYGISRQWARNLILGIVKLRGV